LPLRLLDDLPLDERFLDDLPLDERFLDDLPLDDCDVRALDFVREAA
jgi:hypothetical protein